MFPLYWLFILLRLVPFCTWNNLHQGTTDPNGSDCIPWWQQFLDIGPVVPVRLGNTIEKGLGVYYWYWAFTGFIGPVERKRYWYKDTGSLGVKKGGCKVAGYSGRRRWSILGVS